MSEVSSPSTFACPKCKNRISAAGFQPGDRARCPLCQMEFLVAGNSLGRPLDEDEDYRLQSPLPATPDRNNCPTLQSGAFLMQHAPNPPDETNSEPLSELEEAELYHRLMQEEEQRKKAAEKNAPEKQEIEETEELGWLPLKMSPVGLFRTGLFPFIVSIEVLVRVGFLAAAFFVPSFMLANAAANLHVSGGGMSVFGSWFACLFYLVFGGVLGIFSFLYAAALGMSVFLDTGNGRSSIVNWPHGFLFDWLLEAGYIAGAAFWSSLPGIPLGWLLGTSGIFSSLIFAVCMAVIFPLALMAAIESGTFFFPGAATVWKSPLRARPVWCDFYTITLPMLAIAVGFVAYAVNENLAWMLALASLFAAACWMLYFRLLGRLAWYASGKGDRRID